VKLESHATVLLVPDVRRAGDYYRDRLGFDVNYFEQNPSHYAYAARDGVSSTSRGSTARYHGRTARRRRPTCSTSTSTSTTSRQCTRS
jgi:catechol 2,3-dioxygenase-like lactoylglutathione lyase family enzyme